MNVVKHAYVFPGQGAQFSGMGKDLYHNNAAAKELFEQANDILGFRITDIMFEGSDEDLKQTRVTQPAIFLHSLVLFKIQDNIIPNLVAGHSLGEFTALAATGVVSFEDGLRLVSQRAMAMQRACEINPSSMSAVLGLDDKVVEEICAGIKDEVVVAANYNCPGQLVISGTFKGLELAAEQLKAAGAKRVLPLPVGGAFHSPLMEPARQELEAAIQATMFYAPTCPVYQNVDAQPYITPEVIKQNLINQLTAPVRWTQTILKMQENGVTRITECGPGNVLQGLAKKIAKDIPTDAVSAL